MGDVVKFLDGQSFEPELLAIMGAAFDRACANMDNSLNSSLAKEVIASRIISRAKTGDRDVASLVNHGLWNIDNENGALGRKRG